jgi:hypothetical protein
MFYCYAAMMMMMMMMTLQQQVDLWLELIPRQAGALVIIADLLRQSNRVDNGRSGSASPDLDGVGVGQAAITIG